MRRAAIMLLTLSVVDLVVRGGAALSEREAKKLFRTSRVLVLRSPQAGEGFAATVAAAAGGDGVPVQDLAWRIFGGRVRGPELSLLAAAKSLLEPTGAVVAGAGKVKRAVGSMIGVGSFEIDDAGAEALRDEWRQLQSRWEDWRAANAALSQQLMTACRSAMDRARDTD